MKETVRIITPGNCDYFRKVVIPAALGDDTGEAAPKNGAYRNALVEYEENGALYIYSSDGIYTKISVESGEYIAGNGINISDGVISANVQRVYLKSANTVPAGGDTPNGWINLLPAGMYVIDYYRSVLTDQPSVAGVMVVYHTGNTSTDGKIYHWFYSSDGYVYRREGANQDTTWRLDWSAAPKIDDSFISTRMIAGNAVTTDKVRRPSRGQWYASIPVIGNDGVAEVGKYLDFHDTDDGTSDYDTRLISDDGKLYIGSTSANARVAKIGDIPTYTAGDNVSITNGVISATDTTYTAGTGIDITNGVISCTFADGDSEEY